MTAHESETPASTSSGRSLIPCETGRLTSPPCHTADPEGKQFFSEVIRASSEALALDPSALLNMTPEAVLTLALDRVRAIDATISTLQRQADALGNLRALLHWHEAARAVDEVLKGAA